MNHQLVFEDDLNDWLEEGPTDAPDRVLDTVLAAFPSIPQRRRAARSPWRFPPMNGYARALAAIAAVAVVAFGGWLMIARPSSDQVGGGPRESPATPTLSPSPIGAIDTSNWTSFDSLRYGVSVRHPVGWVVTRASVPWPAGTEPADPPSPMLDTVESPTGVVFVVVSQPLPTGVTGETWLAIRESTNAARFPTEVGCWPTVTGMERVTVGGQPGWVHSGCDRNEAIVFSGGRVYDITQYPDPTYNRAMFDAFLSTVALDPAKADDSPARMPDPSAK